MSRKIHEQESMHTATAPPRCLLAGFEGAGHALLCQNGGFGGFAIRRRHGLLARSHLCLQSPSERIAAIGMTV